MVSIITSQVIQLGFAGFCLILCAMIVYMFNQVIKVVRTNTKTTARLIAMLDARPCLHHDRALQDYHDRD